MQASLKQVRAYTDTHNLNRIRNSILYFYLQIDIVIGTLGSKYSIKLEYLSIYLCHIITYILYT